MGQENIQFGHQKGKLATLVDLPSRLTELEASLRDYLHSQKAWLVDESTEVRRKFKPHATVQILGGLHEGDVFLCDRLYLIEQLGNQKSIAAKIPLPP
jgi:hypothetical protein